MGQATTRDAEWASGTGPCRRPPPVPVAEGWRRPIGRSGQASVEQPSDLASARAAQQAARLELADELAGAHDEVVARDEGAQQRELRTRQHQCGVHGRIEGIEQLGAHGGDLLVEGVEECGAIAAADPQALVAREVAAAYGHARAGDMLAGDDPDARSGHDDMVDRRKAGAGDAAAEGEAALLEFVGEPARALGGDARGERAGGQRSRDAARRAALGQGISGKRGILEIREAHIGEGKRRHDRANGSSRVGLERARSANAPRGGPASLPPVRLAVISDTHLPKGNRTLPERCEARCRQADAILHGGDINDLATLQWLRTLGPPVHAVWGNNCTEEVRTEIPKELELELAGVRIGMVHIGGPAAGRPERLARRFPGCGLVVFGHSHVPEHHVTESGVHVLNPGSPTERRRAPHCAMALVDLAGGVVERVELVPL